jgi:Sulfate permease family
MVRLLQGLRPSAGYRREWLRKDLVAGVVLTTLLVPQGMAYAELAGLPPITGLYTSVLCLTTYAIFGPSRVLVLGPDSSLWVAGGLTGQRTADSHRGSRSRGTTGGGGDSRRVARRCRDAERISSVEVSSGKSVRRMYPRQQLEVVANARDARWSRWHSSTACPAG